MNYTVTFASLPKSLEEMMKLKEAQLQTPQDTAALTVACLALYPENKEEAIRMLDYLRGPRPLSVMEQQFLRDRFMDGRSYIPYSYFHGASVENNYTPSVPYVIGMSDSHAAIAEEGYRIMDLKSAGADHARTVTLRLKPSTGQWFLFDQALLAQIREPAKNDPWA
jgi:hypothetical protein